MTHVYDVPEPVCATGNELGEGPVWLPETREIGWVDIPAGRFYRYADGRAEPTVAGYGQPVSAVVVRAKGGLALAARDGVLLTGPDGSVEKCVDVEPDQPANRLGDAAVDPFGRLWFGTLAADLTIGRGTLYRLDGGGVPEPVVAPTSISNGLGWSPDGRTMYFVDSATRRVDAFDVDPATGLPCARRPWVTVADADGIPDGLAVDAEGGVWVALWRGAQVRRYTPDGQLDAVVPLPVRQVTSCAFGGDDLDELYITTATAEMDARQRRAEPLAGALFRCRTRQRGQPQNAFQG